MHPVNRFERFQLPVAGLAIHPLGVAHVIKMPQSITRNDFVSKTNRRRFKQALSSHSRRGDFRDSSRGLQFPLKLRTEQ
jgi:hypothetical protein